MSNVINLPPRKKDVRSSSSEVTSRANPVATPVTVTSQDPLSTNNLLKINELEEELLSLVDEFVLTNHCTSVFSSRNPPPPHNMPNLKDLKELVVFSPEIQQEGFAKSSTARERPESFAWGDVFIKIGDEYPFLFTMYTKSYVQNQLLYYGEKIEPSSKDIVLHKKHLQREDVIRAVIKWVNLYCPSLMGRPISLESNSILQTLVCDPFVEIQCPESTL